MEHIRRTLPVGENKAKYEDVLAILTSDLARVDSTTTLLTPKERGEKHQLYNDLVRHLRAILDGASDQPQLGSKTACEFLMELFNTKMDQPKV